jgi:dihydroorotase
MLLDRERTLVDLALVNARIHTTQGLVMAGIAIEDGKIWGVTKEERLPKASQTIDLHGNLVLPGLIDVHTHLRGLSLEYKEDFYSGTCAALAGGFTTVLDMPNTPPLTNSAPRLREKMALVQQACVANVGFFACLPTTTEAFHALKDQGVVGFKVFLHRPLTALDVDNDVVLRQVLTVVKDLDLLLAVHAEDRGILDGLEAKFQAEPDASPSIHAKTHPPRAETRAVKRVLKLIHGINPRLHFCHISTGQASALISRAKTRGLHVTYEVTPHHLLLSASLLNTMQGLALVDPPLRSYRAKRGLWRDFLTGRVDIMASDHAPHSLHEKRRANVWDIPSGFPGLETTLPLLLTQVHKGRLTLGRVIDVLARNPARIFRLNRKGAIAKGFDADLTVVDFTEEFVIDASTFHSKAKYSPFEGKKVVGKPVQVFLGGQLVMNDGEIVSKPGSGRILSPNA